MTYSDLLLNEIHSLGMAQYETEIAAVLRVLIDEAENFYDPCEGKVAAVRVDDILKIIEELEQF